MLPGTIEKHHFHVKPILSNSIVQSNNVNSLSNSDNNNISSQNFNANSIAINENDERNDIDDCAINVFRSFNNNRNNNSN